MITHTSNSKIVLIWIWQRLLIHVILWLHEDVMISFWARDIPHKISIRFGYTEFGTIMNAEYKPKHMLAMSQCHLNNFFNRIFMSELLENCRKRQNTVYFQQLLALKVSRLNGLYFWSKFSRHDTHFGLLPKTQLSQSYTQYTIGKMRI